MRAEALAGRVRCLGMTSLGRDVEEALCAAPTDWLIAQWNARRARPKILAVGDHYGIVQRIASVPGLAESIITSEEYAKVKHSEIPLATIEELVAEYNKHAEKPVKGFRTRAIAEERVAAVLPAPRGRRPMVQAVRATGAGESNVRESSVRGQVLAYIREKGEVLKADLDRHFGFNTAGYIGKLAEKGHIETVAPASERKAAAAAEAA